VGALPWAVISAARNEYANRVRRPAAPSTRYGVAVSPWNVTGCSPDPGATSPGSTGQYRAAILTLTCFSRACGSRSITVTCQTSSPDTLSFVGDLRPVFSS
jgi:hypothetical protein